MRIQLRHLSTNKFALQPNMQIFVKTVSITCRPYSRYCLVFSHRLTPSACVYALRSRLQRSRRRTGVFECAKIAPCRSLNFCRRGANPPGVQISSKKTIQEIDASVRGWIKRVSFLMRVWMRRMKRSFGAFTSFWSRHIGARAFLDFGRFFLLSLIFWTFYSPHAFLFSFMFNSSRARRSPSKSSLRTPSTTSRRKSKTKRASRRISSD